METMVSISWLDLLLAANANAASYSYLKSLISKSRNNYFFLFIEIYSSSFSSWQLQL
jgi:thymidylate synthase